MDLENEELVDGYQTVPHQPGALIWGGQLSGSVSNPFHIHVYPAFTKIGFTKPTSENLLFGRK